MWDQLADSQTINKTIEALKTNGINAVFVEDEQQARQKVLGLIPEGSEVMTMTSKTLEAIGVLPDLNESGKYKSVRAELNSMDRATQGPEMQKLGAAPLYVTGSVHAVTADGKVLIASNTGSQLPAYAYGSSRVVWVVGAQKLVLDFDAGLKRIYEHVLPLENERAMQAYGKGSFVSKLLVINREVTPNRINMIIVNRKLGF